ncbi:hypothetical protein ASPCAL03955 [Aspergillus calidoustus]|uniref:Uncharacterized protein n=1 Tax=Aspergillus calidoustus TaxID=454130 RepID=A0A0U5FXC0_ASPCI|nr:hypothetical protein ASPCAL03955 [Aspergillus calidoustus]
MTGSVPSTLANRKAQAVTKCPDSAVVFGNKRVEPLIPTVVVEVGFSQSYEDLVLDARQWLLRSTRPPNVVILVKIEEGIASLRSHKCTIAYQSRLKTLLLQHCDAYALASADLDGTGAPEINVDVLRKQIVIEDWVENLRVFIEVWLRSSAESDNICSRGARCHILPVPETPTDPVLYITDLIPDQHQQRFQPFDRNRQLTLDMKDFESVFPDS